MKTLTVISLILLSFTFTIAQTAQYDVRLVQQHPFQCGDNLIYFDIQVKASSPENTFRIAEQNYRFDYDTLLLANPRIDQELGLSGVMDDVEFNVYSAHSINGTIKGTVSYNINFLFGPGYLLTNEWLPIGRLAFDILDPTGCLNLVWHTDTDFPPTDILTINTGSSLSRASSGAFNDYSGCFTDICLNCPPFLNLSYIIPDNLYRASMNINSNGVISNGSSVTYKAGNNILLGNGFSAQAQSFFSAEISGCD